MTDLRTRACQFIIREAAHHNDGCEPALLVKELVGALDTIDKARELHQQAKSYREYAAPPLIVCGQCDVQWPCPTWLALNGGKECPATRPGGTFPCSWDCNEHGCQIERNGGNESGDDR